VDINLLIPRILLVYITPGLFPTLVIFLANTNLFRFQNPGIVIFVFLVVDIILSIFLENIRFSFFQKFSINKRKFFSKNLYKFFSLVKSDEIFTLNEAWEHYENEEQAAIKLWIISNIEKSGGLIKILGNFDSYRRYVVQACKKYENLKEELEKIPQIKATVENGYLRPTLTTGDRWVILGLLQEEAKSFVWEEYFLFYQSSYNTMLSCLFAFMLNYVCLFLSYKVWSESKNLTELLKICFYRPTAMTVLGMLLVFCCVLLFFNSRLISDKNKDKEGCFKDLVLRVTIFYFIVAFFVIFFPIVKMSTYKGIFYLISILSLTLMLLSYRFVNYWGLAVSRLARKSILYSHINVNK
jgi:hypothetical protein